MEEIKHIEDVVCDNGNIAVKPNNKSVHFAVILAALVLAIFAIQLNEVSILRYLLFLMAVVMAAFGVVGAAKPAKGIYYIPTGEKVKKYVFYFDVADKKAVSNAVRSGELDLLKIMTAKGQGNMMAVIYATSSLKYYASQLQTYVPHEYVPVEETVIK